MRTGPGLSADAQQHVHGVAGRMHVPPKGGVRDVGGSRHLADIRNRRVGSWCRRDRRRERRARDRRNGTRAGSFAAARRQRGEYDERENKAAGAPDVKAIAVPHAAGHVIRRRTLVSPTADRTALATIGAARFAPSLL